MSYILNLQEAESRGHNGARTVGSLWSAATSCLYSLGSTLCQC